MPDRQYHQPALLCGAALVGLVAFGNGSPWLQGFIILIPTLWALTTSRMHAGGVLALYALVMTRGMPSSAASFYGHDWAWLLGVACWMVVVGVFFITGYAVWHPRQRGRIIAIPLLLLFWILPPLGLIGWGHPFLAAGYLFPDWGWWGLLATTGATMIMAARPWLLLALPALLAYHYVYHPTLPTPPENWTSVDTHYPETNKRPAPLAEYRRYRSLQQQMPADARVIVFPEGIAEVWNSVAEHSWRQAMATNQTALIGALIPDKQGHINAIMQVTPGSTQIAYLQRHPLPFVMWRPWAQDGIHPVWNQPGTARVDGYRVAFLICNEILLVWPAVQSLLNKPELIVTASSVWWAPPYVVAAQRSANQGWSRLFGIPIIDAYNK